jgi:hypothetical protein
MPTKLLPKGSVHVTRFALTLVLTLLLTLLLAVGALAEGPIAASEKETPTSMPTFTGKGKLTEAINGKVGAVFDIGSGITMSFPKGLPVGESRLVTLQKGKALPGKLVHAKWKGVGPVLDFNGAFTTSRSPIVLAINNPKDPSTAKLKLVVAMEISTLCDDTNKAHKLKNGLCSGFELHDAEYDDASKKLVAKLASTGGMRMQFGLVPADEVSGKEDE